jgi:single stranded DNA-binding protein
MATSINSVTLCGRLGKDPEIKQIGRDNDAARLSVATTRYKNQQGVEITDWHMVAIYGGACKVVESMRKGDLITIIGQLQHRSYDKNGQKVYVSEVVVAGPGGQVVPCGSPSGRSQGNGGDRGGYDRGQGGNGSQGNGGGRDGGRGDGSWGGRREDRQTARDAGRGGYDRGAPPGNGNGRDGGRGAPPPNDLDDEIPF